MSDNMTLWNAVSKTNPNDTKHVQQRGGFTAIDAYAQIENATSAFGPVGKGWGWEVIGLHFEANCVLVHLNFWYRQLVNGGFGEVQSFHVLGAAELLGKRLDTDAPKKALTDAITKALSYLGFNADVFRGKFDDNKYVEQRYEEVAQETAGSLLVTFQQMVADAKTKAALRVIFADIKAARSELGSDNYAVLTQLITTKGKSDDLPEE